LKGVDTPQVDGIALHIDGSGDHTVLMLHGWPDTYRLWDGQVQALAPTHRCVRFTLPGFDTALPRRPVGLRAMVDFIARVADTVSPDRPVTLLMHDWGCVFGWQYALQQPQRVARIVAVDVGDAGSPAHVAALPAKAKLAVLAYQGWLALAWLVGGHVSRALGDRMTRAMARWARCPAPPGAMGAQMNYPYFITWTGAHGSYRQALPVAPACPVLYVYGQRKPFMFHSPAWAAALALRPGSAVLGLRTGHWVMLQQPEAFNQALRDFLAQPPA
jgi:pimeloyl-ACP methyl ester carboxylesterase